MLGSSSILVSMAMNSFGEGFLEVSVTCDLHAVGPSCGIWLPQ